MSSLVGMKNARKEPLLARSKEIDFWFTMGSTYSYLSVMRLAEVESLSGVGFRWRPFHLLTLLQEMKHIPFADKPAKAAYMWRDIERRAQRYGIPVSIPAPYPVKQSIVANRIALFGLKEGWGRDFIRVAYRRWLQLGQETGGCCLSVTLRDSTRACEIDSALDTMWELLTTRSGKQPLSFMPTGTRAGISEYPENESSLS